MRLVYSLLKEIQDYLLINSTSKVYQDKKNNFTSKVEFAYEF